MGDGGILCSFADSAHENTRETHQILHVTNHLLTSVVVVPSRLFVTFPVTLSSLRNANFHAENAGAFRLRSIFSSNYPPA